MLTLFYIIALISYGGFVGFHFYYEVIKPNPEAVLKYQVSKVHKDIMRAVGFIWSIIFFISLLSPAVDGLQMILFCALGLASLPWLYNVVKHKIADRQKNSDK